MVRQSVVDPRRAWLGAAAGLVFAVILAGVFGLGMLANPYDQLQDQLFPAPPTAGDVTLVAIDESTGATISPGSSYPWSNSYHATVLRNLAAEHPKAIVWDILLDRRTGIDNDEVHTDSDVALQQAIDFAATQTNLVLVCEGNHQPLPDFAARHGVAVADRAFALADAAGNVRGIQLTPARPCAESTARQSLVTATLAALGIARSAIPTEAGDTMLVNFTRGGRATTCSYLVAFNTGCPRSAVTGKVVVVGLKLVTSGDIINQPVAFAHDASFCPVGEPQCMKDNQNYGYRVTADAVSTALHRSFLRIEPPGWVLAVVALVALLLGPVLYLLPLRTGVPVSLIALSGYVLAILLLARGPGLLADPLFAPAQIVLTAVGALMVRNFFEERERRKVEGIFSQYLDPAVVSRLVALRSAEDVQLGGERRLVTVLFADVRGFTGMSESLPPEEVIALVNDFTERCSAIIAEEHGTLDKFIGDAVMALWGAPDDCPEQADLALRAGMRMAEHGAEALGERGIRLGVGVCTGEVVVGNVGGRARKSYTAIGDVVNTASRLCSAAPGGTVLVADSTWERLTERPAAEELEPMTVKGRRAPIGVRAVHVHQAVASPV